MAGPRLDEVKDNCFRLPGRINSTLGRQFSFTDYVRSTHDPSDHRGGKTRLQRASQRRAALLNGLQTMSRRHPVVTRSPRGRGLMLGV